MEVIRIFLKRLKLSPLLFYLVIKDYIIWLRHRGWTIFEGFGLHLYLGAFGQGKTCSMVRDCYNLCKRYKGLTVLTNITLYNFPEGTNVLPLHCIQDILDAPENTIVLIDEIGTIFNSRDYMKSKGKGEDGGGLPKVLFQYLCQTRHRNIIIMGTAQDWIFVEKQIGQITTDVTVCSSFPAHPFSRMITNRVYNAREYDLFYQNPLFPLVSIDSDVYIQTDKLRALYDTKEMVDTMLKMDYIPDSEILANQGDVAPAVVGAIDKKEQKRLLSMIKKGGL